MKFSFVYFLFRYFSLLYECWVLCAPCRMPCGCRNRPLHKCTEIFITNLTMKNIHKFEIRNISNARNEWTQTRMNQEQPKRIICTCCKCVVIIYSNIYIVITWPIHVIIKLNHCETRKQNWNEAKRNTQIGERNVFFFFCCWWNVK